MGVLWTKFSSIYCTVGSSTILFSSSRRRIKCARDGQNLEESSVKDPASYVRSGAHATAQVQLHMHAGANDGAVT
jgi:hypothetical protein